MPTASDLRTVVGTMLRVDPADVSESTSMKQFSSSLERVKLASGLRGIGLSLPSGSVGPTFSDLVRQVGLEGGGNAVRPADVGPFVPSVTESVEVSFGIGCDLECIAAIPAVSDPWEDPFFRSTFTDVEIARCLVEQDPRVHFAGIWCAKEALKKSRPGFESLAWNSIQVVHDERGAPRFEVATGAAAKRLPCSVSISHTGEHAMAVVAWLQSPTQPPVSHPAFPPAQKVAAGSGGGRYIAVAAVLIASGAFLLSLYTALKH